MQLKEYQLRALESFSRWLKHTEKARAESENAIASLDAPSDELISSILNYPKNAWSSLNHGDDGVFSSSEYVERTADAGFSISHICFKVPTGGGKTLLAAAALERLNQPNGLVLWMVPSNAIYRQTKSALWNKEHPYRKMLERASGGRVKMLEKNDFFTASDIEHYLCVMLISLQSANRMDNKEFLKIFQDSGKYTSFFPDFDDIFGEHQLRNQYIDLDPIDAKKPIKQSLFNVIKMCRPVVILDEAHKAYGKSKNDEFVGSINRLNPSIVLELSATPNPQKSNLLVDVSGTDLKDEEMIKLPIQVISLANAEWQNTLIQAHQQLETLNQESKHLLHNSGRYIRPIAVVRVERTGSAQRDTHYVHANDVRNYLMQNLGVPSDAVAIQTAEIKELSNVDLMSDLSHIQWIITRDALREGWDCSFAYLLVILDNTTAKTAITQLIGRVMRQPHASLTGREPLDRCYIHCQNVAVGEAVQHVKDALEQEGMTGLEYDIEGGEGSSSAKPVAYKRRSRFKDLNIVLPKVVHYDQSLGWIGLDYTRHIVPAIDWGSITPPQTVQPTTHVPHRTTAIVDVENTSATEAYGEPTGIVVDTRVRLAWYARRLSDIVPNPFQSARIVQELMTQLYSDGYTKNDVYAMRSSIVSQLRDNIFEKVDDEAERVFRRKLAEGTIRFDLTSTDHNHFITKENKEILVAEDDRRLERFGEPLSTSLFEPVFDRHFNGLERNFVFFLEEQKIIQWWHRVSVRQPDEYYLRGWRPDRIWPDFVAMASLKNGRKSVLVLETKGSHLKGNEDTEYKKAVFDALEETFNAQAMTIEDGPIEGIFRLVFDTEDFSTVLPSEKD